MYHHLVVQFCTAIYRSCCSLILNSLFFSNSKAVSGVTIIADSFVFSKVDIKSAKNTTKQPIKLIIFNFLPIITKNIESS